MIAETALDTTGLASQLAAILGDPAIAETMAARALGVGRVDATDRLVALVTGLARRK